MKAHDATDGGRHLDHDELAEWLKDLATLKPLNWSDILFSKAAKIQQALSARITPDATDVKDKFGGAAYAWPTGAATPLHAAEQLIPNGETRTIPLGGQHAFPSETPRTKICKTTGNPCGTDTVFAGQECPGGGPCTASAPSAIGRRELDLQSALLDLYTLCTEMGWHAPDNRYHTITRAAELIK